MKNSKRIIALFLALVIVIAGSNLFLDHKLKASETNGDTTAQEQQDTAESAQTVVEIIVPKQTGGEPAQEAPAEPVQEAPAEPVQEEAQVTEPTQEEAPVAEPVKEEIPAENPETEQNDIAAEPVFETENIQPEENTLPEAETEAAIENEEIGENEGESEETETLGSEENSEEAEVVENGEDAAPEAETEKTEREDINVTHVSFKSAGTTAAIGQSVSVIATIKVDNTEDTELKPFILEVTASDGRLIDREQLLFCSVMDGYVADAGERFEKYIDFVPFMGEATAVELIVTIRADDEDETMLYAGALSFTPEAAEETEEQPENEPQAEPETEPKTENEEIPEIEPETEEIPEIGPETEDEEIPEIESETEDEEIPEIEPETEGEEIPEIEPETEDEEITKIEPEPENEETIEPEPVPEQKPAPVWETPKPSAAPTVKADAEPETEEEIEIPELEEMLLFDTIEFEDDANRYIELYVWYDGYTDGKALDFGQVLNITAVLYGFEDDTDITYQWQVSKDGETFTDIEKADKRVYSIVISEENCADYYRVIVLSEKMA